MLLSIQYIKSGKVEWPTFLGKVFLPLHFITSSIIKRNDVSFDTSFALVIFIVLMFLETRIPVLFPYKISLLWYVFSAVVPWLIQWKHLISPSKLILNWRLKLEGAPEELDYDISYIIPCWSSLRGICLILKSNMTFMK